jgi:hypothetical protein
MDHGLEGYGGFYTEYKWLTVGTCGIGVPTTNDKKEQNN